MPHLLRCHPTLCADRGYAERSRRARAWDPESAVYAKGASTDHAASPESCNVEWNGGRERGDTFMMACPGARDDARDHRSEKRNRHKCVAADEGHPVEMDWKEVTRRFGGLQADWVKPTFFFFFGIVSLCFIVLSNTLRSNCLGAYIYRSVRVF